MSTNPNQTALTPSRRCSQLTAGGQPCQAWAVHGSEPPLCSAHAGRNVGAGAPLGNRNRLTHGFYSTAFSLEELEDVQDHDPDSVLKSEIACARVALRRVLALLNAPTVATFEDGHQTIVLTPADFARLVGLALQATRTVARLLRDKRALSGEAADGIASAIAQALDELSTEWGVDL